MTELIIQVKNDTKQIALIENEKLVEYYKEDEETLREEGNIYIGIIKDILSGMQAAFVDIGTEKKAFIHLKDLLEKVDETQGEINQETNIKDIIKTNQKILVQIKKDSNENKGARVSTHVNLPSKYIALMPNTNIITVSKKIEDKKEQQRLIKLAKEHLSKNNGAIIRTSAQNKEKEVIEDIKEVEEKWQEILREEKKSKSNKAKILYRSKDIVEKMLTDLGGDKIGRIVVNDKKEEKRLQKLKQDNKEYKNIKIELIEKDELLDLYRINSQIEKLQKRKIWLKCGGFITIDKTEALTAIDVNTGKYTGTHSLEQTIYKVNKEATIEIAKQLRLRDIGGIIIIDYIDMENEEHKQKIEEILREELKKDRTKTQIEGFTKLDLMELTRKHICSHND